MCFAAICSIMHMFMSRRSHRITGLCVLAIILTAGFPFRVHAEGEDPDFSDTEYWNRLCTNTDSLSDEDVKNCQAYTQYMQERNSELQSQIADIDARKEEISAKISDYDNQIAQFNAQIEGITGMIQDLSMQIKAVEEQIADIQSRIDANQKAIVEKQNDIDDLKAKVAKRLVEEQKTMHSYQFLDILMGAATFEDFVRLASGLNDIYAHDSHSLEQLTASIDSLHEMEDQLKSDQEEVKAMETELAAGKQALDSQQAALLSSRYELQILQQNYNAQLAAADQEKTSAQNAIAANQSQIGNIKDSIANRPEATAKSEASDSGESSASDAKPESSDTGTTPASTAAPKPASTPAPSSGGSSTAPETGNTDGNPYYGGWANCTWGTWQLVHDTLGISLPGWGMAGNWMNDAARSGYATGSTPKVYSIAVYSWHVGFVTAVDGDRVYIKEGNYLGHYYERWVPVDGLPYSGQTCLGYIYL